MIHPLSPLGVIHTVISLVPIIAGIYGFIRYHMIDTSKLSGKIYLISLALAVITSFGVSSTGGLNEGHAVGVLILIIAFGSLLVPKIKFLGKLRPYLSVLGLSLSFFLSLVPGVNETLTRLPVTHPMASAPLASPIPQVLSVLFILFIVGYITQCVMIHWNNSKKV